MLTITDLLFHWAPVNSDFQLLIIDAGLVGIPSLLWKFHKQEQCENAASQEATSRDS